MNRLTKKNDGHYEFNGKVADDLLQYKYNKYTVLGKLGEIEDLMEKYGINSIEKLEQRLDSANEYDIELEERYRIKEKYAQLNKIFGDAHICEIQKEFSNYEPLCENSECEKCPLGVGDAVCLKHAFETKWKVQTEYWELKKASDLAKRKITYLLYIKNCPTYEKFADGFYKKYDDCPNEEEYNILKRWMNNSSEENI